MRSTYTVRSAAAANNVIIRVMRRNCVYNIHLNGYDCNSYTAVNESVIVKHTANMEPISNLGALSKLTLYLFCCSLKWCA